MIEGVREQVGHSMFLVEAFQRVQVDRNIAAIFPEQLTAGAA